MNDSILNTGCAPKSVKSKIKNKKTLRGGWAHLISEEKKQRIRDKLKTRTYRGAQSQIAREEGVSEFSVRKIKVGMGEK